MNIIDWRKKIGLSGIKLANFFSPVVYATYLLSFSHSIFEKYFTQGH